MNVKKPITPAITIGDQPTENDLKALKGEGYVGVINLRNDGEPEQPLGTSAEGEKAKALGLDYLHYGVGSAPLTEDAVSAVCQFLDGHAGGKTLVHCRKGGRAAALVLLYKAAAENWSPDEAVARGNTLGLAVDGGLRTLVETYLREHGRSKL
ncbi:MAG: protein tyrosine phosphatase family protein [Planctomycetia bacterium]|nr:protein tyrosine phosphatase family protein [Planctomycetia bacterium]